MMNDGDDGDGDDDVDDGDDGDDGGCNEFSVPFHAICFVRVVLVTLAQLLSWPLRSVPAN